MRTLLLVGGGVLIAALVVSLAVGRLKNKLNLSEVPKKLGVDIQQEANGVTYTQSHGGKTLFKIHASKVVQLKDNNKALLHDVQIELYGADGSRVDHISGNEFEYDQKAGTAAAAGPVEITIMRPGTAPAMAPKATTDPNAGQIDVKTSGLTFNQKTGTAVTDQHVDFALAQGTGSATGATFDSNKGVLVLDRDVVLDVQRGAQPVHMTARHGEFERDSMICNLDGATAVFRKGHAAVGAAKILFRKDGSAVRMDARDGVTLVSANGATINAPTGWLEFDEKSQPERGHLEGGVKLLSVSGGRQAHGSAPVADFEFAKGGVLRHAHLEQGVVMQTEEDTVAHGQGAHVSREWQSPVAELQFRPVGKGTELDTVDGTGGVVMTGQTRRGDGSMSPSRMAADKVNAKFAAGGQLQEIVGTGHATVEQVTATGTRQTTTGDSLDAHYAPGKTKEAAELQSAVVDGSVVLTQQKPAKAGQAVPPQLRATAGHAVYEGAGEWLHLTVNPRVLNGGMELTADRVDVAQGTGKDSGHGFAHGNVKATWANDGRGDAVGGTVGLGGNGPSHVIASEAEFQQTTGEATFRGNARLWQDANSVTAPVIVLNQTKKTLAAHGAGAAEPVRVVALSAGGAQNAKDGQQAKGSTPSLIRARGDELEYADATRRAVLHAGSLGAVTTETATATSTSDEVELILLPAGTKPAQGQAGQASQVDRMIARGNVVLTSTGRRGTGQQLVYTGKTEDYTLTGTTTAPPKITDAAQGTVVGNTLIFNSRDDSVRVEGGSEKTATATHTPN